MSSYLATNTAAETVGTTDFRVFFESVEGKRRISPWHDIPLHVSREAGVFNAVMEIPRGTQEKMEISKGEAHNPIKQDVKNGKLRQVTYQGGYPFNYGAFPQTYENPSHVDPNTQAKGDDDPLDVCEVGSAVARRGDVKQVKVLGCLAMIDEGETDWKVLVIDIQDPKASEINSIADAEAHFPGLLENTREWFRNYKTVDGKPQNQFAFNGEYKDRDFALSVIEENYHFWKQLRDGSIPNKGHSLL